MSARDNGLSAGSYVFVTSVTPPVAPDLLAELGEEGIAAYTVPSEPDVHRLTRAMPAIRMPMERLYVDRVSASYAHVLVRRRLAAYEESQPEEATRQSDAVAEPSDEDEAWRRILAGYDQPVDDVDRPWPAAEDVSTADGEATATAASATVEPAAAPDRDRAIIASGYDAAEEEEEHFVPPPPPPLPKEDMPTKAAFAAIAAGLASLCLMMVFDWARQWWIVLLTVAVLAAGVVTHVLRISDPRNPGSDDGAQV